MAINKAGRLLALLGFAVTVRFFVSAPGPAQAFVLGFQAAVVLFAFLL
jgi:hypothetical protein